VTTELLSQELRCADGYWLSWPTRGVVTPHMPQNDAPLDASQCATATPSPGRSPGTDAYYERYSIGMDRGGPEQR